MKTNKVIASALAFIMATTIAAGSVYAAGEKVTISADKVEATAGSEFTVNVMLSDVPATGVMACEFALTYDSSVLNITGITAGEIANTGSDGAETDISGECPSFYADYSTAGTINVTWSTGLTDTAYWIAKDGVLATITGTVAENAAAGDYEIGVTAISRDDISGTNSSILIGYVDSNKQVVEYEAVPSNGAVTVVAETTTTEPPVTTTEPPVVTTTEPPVVTTTEPPVTTTEPPVVTTTDAPQTTTVTTVTTEDIPGTTNGQDQPVEPTLIGDVNLDGKISLVDVVYLNKYLVQTLNLNPTAQANAQCVTDAEGRINSADSTALLEYVIETIKELPVLPE